MTDCTMCGGLIAIFKQTFSNGKIHLRRECANCHKFYGYASQGKSFKDRCFELVELVADAEPDALPDLKYRANELINEVKGEKT